MYVTEELRKELDFFRRSNGHFEISAGKSTVKVQEASDELLYMTMSASLIMEYSEDGFFENFVITDKSIAGRSEMMIDAYALIETDDTKVQHLHVFQYKLHEKEEKSASPVELMNFATFVNNNFVHPEFLDQASTNEVVLEIKKKCETFLSRRGRVIRVYCHYVNNAKGISPSNEKEINNVYGRFLQDRQLLGFSLQVFGLKDIMELALEGKIQVGQETLELVNEGMYSYRLEDNSKRGLGLPKKVIVGMVNVNEFIRLQNKYHHNQLYSENIRLYLGDRGNVNKDIIATITSNESLWFPYMNNGISIICDSMSLGNVDEKRKIQSIILDNMQIINGCQTVNALYGAKYGENTKDNFRPTNVMVRIYEIDPMQTEFKMSIIKATNNQNAVKSFSLVANDPIQLGIANVLKSFGIVYDRKGEGRNVSKGQSVINMVNVSLAYRAVYWYEARSLRSGLGKTRMFQKEEYERIFDPALLEEGNREKFLRRCFRLIIANEILDTVRDLVQAKESSYVARLPIFRKSTYYLAGYLYARNKSKVDAIEAEILDVFESGNEKELRGKAFPNQVRALMESDFGSAVRDFTLFYEWLDMDKTDIDNLLKNKGFGEAYMGEVKKMEKATGSSEN